MRKSDYAKLGTFVIVGTMFLLLVIVVLGAGQYFKTTYTFETYLDESVNGLEVGSPVKLKGVKIGSVARIGFANAKYDADFHYVLVECDVDPKSIGFDSYESFSEAFTRDVQNGLRVRPTSLGLTGQLFLNMDYFDPAQNPPLELSWKPEYLYIPSAPSTLSRLEASVNKISNSLASLKKEDVEAIVSDVKGIVSTVKDVINKPRAKKLATLIVQNLEETRTLLHRVNELAADPAMKTLVPDAAAAVAGVRKLVDEAGPDAIVAMSEIRKASTSMRIVSGRVEKAINDADLANGLGAMKDMMQNVSQISQEMQGAVAKLHSVLGRMNMLVAGEQSNIRKIMDDTRVLMDNLKELSGELKRYPSGALFGSPPSPSNPAGVKDAK